MRLGDVDGKTVAVGTVANGEALVRTGDLAAGTYVLQCSSGSAPKTIKLTKQ